MEATINKSETALTSSEGQQTVPLSWRIGQGVFIALIVLAALYFNAKALPHAVRVEKAGAATISDQIGFLLLIALTWVTTPATAVIALATLREALRRRWMVGVFLLTVAMLMLSASLTRFQPGEEEKFLRDFGMSFITIMTVGMVIILGAGLVPPEIERRTILTILSKPVSRAEYILGKFLGLSVTIGILMLAIGLTFLAVYASYRIGSSGYNAAMQGDASGYRQPLPFDLTNISIALLLHYGQLVLLATLALVMSLFISQITTILFCVTAFFGGQMSSYWQTLGSGARTGDEMTPGLSKPMQGVMNVLYYVLPRFDRFDVREKLVTDSAVSLAYTWRALDFAVIYIAVLLVVSVLIFSDREF
jgi:Cu-processing system permease protein